MLVQYKKLSGVLAALAQEFSHGHSLYGKFYEEVDGHMLLQSMNILAQKSHLSKVPLSQENLKRNR